VIVRRRMIFACLHRFWQAYACKQQRDSRVPCDMQQDAAGASLQAVKKTQASRTATNQSCHRRPRQARMGTELAVSPQNGCVSSLPPHTCN
jgi:hypothetical protein